MPLATATALVPFWKPGDKAFHCHNCLDDTRAWLEQPLHWDHNGGEEASATRCWHIQFARTLATGAAHNPSAAKAQVVARINNRMATGKSDDGGTGAPCTTATPWRQSEAVQARDAGAQST